MSNINGGGLDWLNEVEMTAPDEPKRKGGGGARKERNPENADLRIFKDGSPYPSKALVDKFNLEFSARDVEDQGNGLDIIDSDEFKQYIPAKSRVIFVTVTPRKARGGKLDLFGVVAYHDEKSAAKAAKDDEDDSIRVSDPRNSVLNQGAATFGKDVLLPLIKEVYGVEPNEKGYIDMKFVGPNDQPFRLPSNKPNYAFLPKTTNKKDGTKTGSVIKREKPEFWVLYPVVETVSETMVNG